MKIKLHFFIVIKLALFMLALPAYAANQVESLEQITFGIKDKEMKQRWESSFKAGTLPPLKELQIPDKPVTKRKKLVITSDATLPAKKPSIPSATPIDVQLYIPDTALETYTGNITITDHQPGLVKGNLESIKQPIEILYKIPEKNLLYIDSKSKDMVLEYNNYLFQMSLQRRVILYDKKQKQVKLISISEGDEVPYTKTIKELGIVINQQKRSDEVENPPVEINYRGETATLNQGDQITMGKSDSAIQVHLLNSYAYNPKREQLLEGLPYFVSLIISGR